MESMQAMNILGPVERRCAACGARAAGKACSECGAPVAPRADIGILAGVNNNFGTVNNVYNIGGDAQPEIVDLRDVQDGLNERFPERIPGPPRVPQFPRSAVPRQLGDGMVRKVNVAAYIAIGFVIVGVLGLIAAFIWA